ncbi:transcriptional regulator NrdR, partial [Actinoplanes sp. NPDC049548]
AILTPLRELDQVAYLRFASVYKSFDSLDEFEREITELRDAATSKESAVRHVVTTRSGGRTPKIGDRAP